MVDSVNLRYKELVCFNCGINLHELGDITAVEPNEENGFSGQTLKIECRNCKMIYYITGIYVKAWKSDNIYDTQYNLTKRIEQQIELFKQRNYGINPSLTILIDILRLKYDKYKEKDYDSFYKTVKTLKSRIG